MASTPTLIDLADILLDQTNPRLDDTVDRLGQTEVIRDMMSDDVLGQQVYKLALDVVQYGIDPTALLAVIESPEEAGKYITLEGNRRIVALKLLTNPELVTGVGRKSLERRFKKLGEKFIEEPITEVNCIIFDDTEEADHWIKMRHTGQNDGAGLVEWNALAQGRYAAKKGGTPPEVQVLDFVRDHGTLSQEAKENLPNFKITNLQRILITKDAREAIGLSQRRGVLYTNLPEEEIIKPLRKIIEDLSGDVKVGQLMTKQQRIDYVESLDAQFMPDYSKALEQDVRLSEVTPSAKAADDAANASGITVPVSKGEHSLVNTGTTPRTISDSSTSSASEDAGESSIEAASTATQIATTAVTNQATVAGYSKRELQSISDQRAIIPTRYRRTIPVVRINELFKELKRLPVAELPNAGAVLLRVFIELSVDEYIKNHGITLTKKEQVLSAKIQKCLDHIIGSGAAAHKEMQSVKNFTTETSSLGSTVTLNAYVHNPLMMPEAMSLKITWYNLLPLIERIWP